MRERGIALLSADFRTLSGVVFVVLGEHREEPDVGTDAVLPDIALPARGRVSVRVRESVRERQRESSLMKGETKHLFKPTPGPLLRGGGPAMESCLTSLLRVFLGVGKCRLVR